MAVPAGISTQCGPRAGAEGGGSHWLAEFAVHGQLVQHVAERFGVHQAMFDGDFEQAAMFEARETRVLCAGSANRGVQLFAEAFVVIPNPVDRRPILGLIRWQAALHRVDAKGEELVKVGVEGRKAQRFPEKIPVKRFQVAQIKNYPVAFRDGAVVQCCGADNLEEFFASARAPLEGAQGADRHGKMAPLLPDS